MGQPINVVKKPSPQPGVVRYEANRSFTGMGHERFASSEEIVRSRPVDELARRLFATGDVKTVHVGGSVVTIELVDEAMTTDLAEVIRGLYIHYSENEADGDAPAEPSAEDQPATVSDPAG